MARVLAKKLKGIGLILIAVILVFATVLRPHQRTISVDDWKGFAFAVVIAFIGILYLVEKEKIKETGTKADEDTDREIRRFRENYTNFFEQSGLSENTPLQHSATQFLWHRMALQKRRLDEKGLLMRVQAERKTVKRILSLSAHEFFDGKYRITDVKEIIRGEQIFFSQDRSLQLYRRRLPNVAAYRLLHAERGDGDLIICPNCGAKSTRENLIDGCDYCGTKFSIEDLGNRVSDFAYLPDYAVEKENFDAVLRKYQRIVALVVGGISLIYWLATMSGALRGMLGEADVSPANAPRVVGAVAIWALFSLFLASIFVVLALLAFILLRRRRFWRKDFPSRRHIQRQKRWSG